MLSTGGFSLCNSLSFISTNNARSFSLLHSHKNRLASSLASLFTFCSKNPPFPSSSQEFCQIHLGSRAVIEQNHNVFCVFAVKKGRKGGTELMEVEDFGDEDDWDDYGGDDDNDDEDLGMLLPLGKVKKWLENKPRGFGVGKVYDTSIEDHLLEQLEQSRQAQAANINKLKNSPVHTASGKDDQNKAPEVAPSGIRVRIANLPKKKNIHRDLKNAFRGVSGVMNILPAVTGNKKTKDPVCKGFAFVDFKSERDAIRFVETFSRQSISFGKIQKQIKFDIMNSRNSNGETSSDHVLNVHEPTVPSSESDNGADFNLNDSSLDSWAETLTDKTENSDDDLEGLKTVEVEENLVDISAAGAKGHDSPETTIKFTADSDSPKQLAKIRAIEKKFLLKGKVKKIPKLNVPGSAKRLKIKEKAVLTGVLSKYAMKDALASKEEN